MKNKTPTILFLAMAALSLSGCNAAQRAEALRQNGAQLYLDGKHEEAESRLQEALRLTGC